MGWEGLVVCTHVCGETRGARRSSLGTRRSYALAGLELPMGRLAFEPVLQTEFWRFVREHGWKTCVLFNTITNNLEFTKYCLHIRVTRLKLPFLDSKKGLSVGYFLGFDLTHDFLSYSQRCEMHIMIHFFLQMSNQWGEKLASAHGGLIRWPRLVRLRAALPPSGQWEKRFMFSLLGRLGPR